MPEYSNLFQRVLNSSNQSKENSIGENIETFSKLDSKYQPTSRTTDPNEYAALNQTKLDIAGNILARGVGTFVTGTLGTVAMLHDIPKSVFKAVTGDSDKHEGWDYYMNNSINADLVKAQEDVMKEFPLYDTYKDSKTPFTTKKILDGIAQGAAFIGVGYAGGWLTKGILQSAKLLGNSQKLINFTNKAGKSLAVDNAIYGQINNYLDKGKNVGAAIYNRSFESMLEAKGTGQEIREKLESENQEAFDNTGQYLYNPEDIDNRVRQAEKLNFGFNLALGAIDAYQNLKIFDGFESKIGKAISKNIDDITENVLSNKNLSRFGLPKVGATIVKYGTKSGALSVTGGLEALEELAQFSSNKLSQDLATNNYTKDDWDNLPKLITGIVGQMTDDIQNDPNAQFSALIGGLIGLPMGMVAKKSETKEEALKSKQREIAQQSLIEKNVLAGLYKIKNGKTLEDKVSGEIQTRFSNHQGFQNSVINQINADNFEGLISHLENIKETSIDDLKELEIGVKTDSKGNTIQPSTIINEAIEQAKVVKKVYENVNLAHANKSELVRNNITNLILNGKYFDKKIDLVTNELEAKKADILSKLTKDQNYAEKAFKTVKSKETGKEDLSFFVNGEIKNANIEELDITPETKDEIVKLKEELLQLNKEREFTIKEYNKYRDSNYINKVEKQAQENIENLEKPVEKPTESSVEPTQTTSTEQSVSKGKPVSSTIPNDVSEEDYNNFINTGKISNEILNTIANKVKNGSKLTEKETAIFTDKTSEINTIIKNSVEDNTYYEAPDTFLSASEANAKDIFVPDNLDESNVKTDNEELKKSKKSVEIPTDPKLKLKSFESDDSFLTDKTFIDSEGNYFTVDQEAASTILKNSNVVLKPLTNNGYGAIGIFTADNKLVSILRMKHNVDPNDKNDRGLAVNEENSKLFEQFFGQPYENNGKLKNPTKKGKLEKKPEKVFSAKFSSLNVGSPSTLTLKPTVETALDKNIHYDNNGIPTIVRVLGKFGERLEIIAGDSTISTSDIQVSKSNKSGDTILLFTKRPSQTNPDNNVYPSTPITVKTIGETTVFKEKILSLLNNTFNKIKENIDNGVEKGSAIDVVNFELRGDLYNELRNFIRFDKKTIELKVLVNKDKQFTLEASIPINESETKKITVEVNKGQEIKGIDELKDAIFDVKPSLSVESISSLKEEGQFNVNDYLEAMTISVDKNKPIKGVSIEIFLNKTKKEVIPSTTIKEKVTTNESKQQPTSTTVTEIKAKKADIERRRQEELKDIIYISKKELEEKEIKAYYSNKDKKIRISKGGEESLSHELIHQQIDSLYQDDKLELYSKIYQLLALVREKAKDPQVLLEESSIREYGAEYPYQEEVVNYVLGFGTMFSNLKSYINNNFKKEFNDAIKKINISLINERVEEIKEINAKYDAELAALEKVIKPSDLMFNDPKDSIDDLFTLEVAKKTSDEVPSENQLLTNVGEELVINDELENNNISEKEVEKPIKKLNKNLFSKNTENVTQQEFNLTFNIILNKSENIEFKDDLIDFKNKTKNMNLQAKISAIEEFDKTKDTSVLIKACK